MKLEAFTDWLLIIVIALMVWSLSACGDSKPPTSTFFETNRGVKVIVLTGEDPTAADLSEIDQQVSRIIQIANDYAAAHDKVYVWPGHERHTIELVEPSPECETPGSFQTNAGQYGGTLICVAGRYYPENDRIRTTLKAIRTSKVVQYESEHFGLRLNDEQMYNRTKTHVCPPECPVVYHPIFGVE